MSEDNFWKRNVTDKIMSKFDDNEQEEQTKLLEI
jgi:hypothetical protein